MYINDRLYILYVPSIQPLAPACVGGVIGRFKKSSNLHTPHVSVERSYESGVKTLVDFGWCLIIDPSLCHYSCRGHNVNGNGK